MELCVAVLLSLQYSPVCSTFHHCARLITAQSPNPGQSILTTPHRRLSALSSKGPQTALDKTTQRGGLLKPPQTSGLDRTEINDDLQPTILIENDSECQHSSFKPNIPFYLLFPLNFCGDGSLKRLMGPENLVQARTFDRNLGDSS